MQVYPSPTIAVLSTGDELVEPTTANLSRGQVLHHSRITYISLLVELVVSFGLITEVVDGFLTEPFGLWALKERIGLSNELNAILGLTK